VQTCALPIYVEDHGPDRQFAGPAGRVAKPGRVLEHGSHAATSAGSRRTPASCRSLAQFFWGFGAGIPGRSRGTQTRSAPGVIVQVTGVDSSTASPSMPTGIWAASAVISIFFLGRTVRPSRP